MTSQLRFLGLVLFSLIVVAPAFSQDAAKRREPQPQVRYELGEDSKKQTNIPEGQLVGPFLFQSKIIENTVRKYWISVPSQYDPKQPACVLVFQDGARAINPSGVLRVPQVLENLVAKKLIPVTIGIYITPGQRGAEFPDSIGTGNPDNRDLEYDVLDDKYARMLIDEILPEVAAKYNLTTDPKGRAIGGSSSGGICAFTVAWQRPDQFRNVISLIGSFTNIHGGHVYPQLVRDAAPKPIRVFLQDGVNDLRSPNDLDRDWHLQNQAMVAALNEKKYDMAHVFGDGGHSDDHGGAILPEMLHWIWRDYPGVNSAGAEKLVELARQKRPERIDSFPNFDEKSMINPNGKWKWENNSNRMRRTETLTIEGTRAALIGNLVTSSNTNGETQSSTAKIEDVHIIGNKLIFDVEREVRDRKVKSTYQGIVTEKTILGWNMTEFNGTPRDTPWRADRVNDKPVALITPIGEFESASDVGAVSKLGSASFNSDTQSYEIVGSGSNMWANKDEFHMVWKKLKGDFILDAHAKLFGEGVDPHRKLYRFELADKSITEINTDFATRNNNDHALSFDGKQLGISHHSAEHGWSPDGRFLVFTGQQPIEGGPSRIIAYLYGGQGTINVNSWSPDNQHVAFVSNSKIPKEVAQ